MALAMIATPLIYILEKCGIEHNFIWACIIGVPVLMVSWKVNPVGWIIGNVISIISFTFYYHYWIPYDKYKFYGYGLIPVLYIFFILLQFSAPLLLHLIIVLRSKFIEKTDLAKR